MVQYAVRCAASQELNIDANLYKKKQDQSNGDN